MMVAPAEAGARRSSALLMTNVWALHTSTQLRGIPLGLGAMYAMYALLKVDEGQLEGLLCSLVPTLSLTNPDSFLHIFPLFRFSVPNRLAAPMTLLTAAVRGLLGAVVSAFHFRPRTRLRGMQLDRPGWAA